MKVLFLDIDGVVNCKATTQRHRGFIGIDPYMAFIVGKIVLYSDCKVVLSSTWRLDRRSREEVRKQVCDFIDITPDLSDIYFNYADKPRGHEIQAWLDQHDEVTKYAILDDNNDMLDSQLPYFFETSWDTGITEEIGQKVTDYFNARSSV